MTTSGLASNQALLFVTSSLTIVNIENVGFQNGDEFRTVIL